MVAHAMFLRIHQAAYRVLILPHDGGAAEAKGSLVTRNYEMLYVAFGRQRRREQNIGLNGCYSAYTRLSFALLCLAIQGVCGTMLLSACGSPVSHQPGPGGYHQ